jgi:hypothetical protein
MTALAGEAAEWPPAPPPKTDAPIPWEDPEVPRLRAFFRTLGELLFNPRAFCQRLAGEGWADPLAFGLVSGTVGLLAGIFWLSLLSAAASGLGGGWGAAQSYDGGIGRTGLAVFLMLASPVLVLFDLGFGALCLWGAAAMGGAGKGFKPIWRIYCYAQAGMVAACIPVFGAPLAALLVLFLIYQGVREVLNTSSWRAWGILILFLSWQIFLLTLLIGALAASLALVGYLLLRG